MFKGRHFDRSVILLCIRYRLLTAVGVPEVAC
jgi:transposase-like protein